MNMVDQGQMNAVHIRKETRKMIEERKLTLVKEPPILTISNLTKTFGDIVALDDISLEIPRGRIVGLLGANGSGKTTLIKILAAMYTSYRGQVQIDGSRPSHITKGKVAYLPDKNSFPDNLRVDQIGAFHQRYFPDFDSQKCADLLGKFQIEKHIKVQEMSKGQVDKLQVCMTMARNAELYLLDEPIGGVDVGARDFVLDTVLDSFNPNSTIIVATHLVGQIERLFDSAIILDKGRLAEFEECDTLRTKNGGTIEDYLKERARV